MSEPYSCSACPPNTPACAINWPISTCDLGCLSMLHQVTKACLQIRITFLLWRICFYSYERKFDHSMRPGVQDRSLVLKGKNLWLWYLLRPEMQKTSQRCLKNQKHVKWQNKWISFSLKNHAVCISLFLDSLSTRVWIGLYIPASMCTRRLNLWSEWI